MSEPAKTPAEAIVGTILRTKDPVIFVQPGRNLTAENGVRLAREDWHWIEKALAAAGYEVRAIDGKRCWWCGQ